MGMYVKRKVIATGGRTGKTFVVGGYQFVDGYTIVEGDSDDIKGTLKFLGRSYKAFEQGSAELAYWQRKDQEEAERVAREEAAKYGPNQNDPGIQHGGPVSVPTPVQPVGPGPVPPSTDNGQGADGASQGPQGSVPSGDGQPHTGNDGSPQDEDRILKAVNALDPVNGEHWTAEGQPRVDAVAEILGDPNVTRAQIDAAAPKFIRPAPQQ